MKTKTTAPSSNNQLTPAQHHDLIQTLQTRFDNNPTRHKGINWSDVQSRLEANPQKLWTLSEMERTGGQPDVIAHDKATGQYTFVDCSPESPAGRRSICYDREGLESRKEHRPENTAVDMAAEMGVELLTEDEYRNLQTLGNFDLKTSSWVLTPPEIRKQGGAIFCDRRYDHVFTYHNGAQSYYGSRAFRGSLKV